MVSFGATLYRFNWLFFVLSYTAIIYAGFNFTASNSQNERKKYGKIGGIASAGFFVIAVIMRFVGWYLL